MTLQEKINKLYESGIYDFYVINNIGWDTIDSLSDDDLKQESDNYQLIQFELLLSDARGLYIPRDFYQQFNLQDWHIESDNIELNEPNSEYYWEYWQYILNNAYCYHDGKKWHLLQDGDLFAISYL